MQTIDGFVNINTEFFTFYEKEIILLLFSWW